MIKVKMVEVKKGFTICDFCESGVQTKKCKYCLRDFCSKHGEWSYSNFLTGNDCGDYCEYICHECLEIIKPYTARYEKATEIYEEEIEKIEKEFNEKLEQLGLI